MMQMRNQILEVCCLEEDGKAEKDGAKENSHAGGGARYEGRSSGTGGAPRGSRGGSSAAKASSGGTAACGRSVAGGRGRRHGGAQCGVALVGILSTAGVVIAALGAAGAIAVAVVHTLVAPLLTDEEGECLRVLGDVGRDAVVAHAGVGQCCLVVC